MTTRHKHYEVIRAWCDGKPIQYNNDLGGGWFDYEHNSNHAPSFSDHVYYRIKPNEEAYVNYSDIIGHDATRLDKYKFVMVATGSIQLINMRGLNRWNETILKTSMGTLTLDTVRKAYPSITFEIE